MNIEFGKKYRCIITNRVGIAKSRVIHLTNCDDVGLVNEEGETIWPEADLVELVDDGIIDKLDGKGNKFEDIDESLYEIGQTAKDKVSGFAGTIIMKSISIVGDISYALEAPYDSKKNENKALWYDESRVELIEEEPKKEIKTKSKRTGGFADPGYKKDIYSK